LSLHEVEMGSNRFGVLARMYCFLLQRCKFSRYSHKGNGKADGPMLSAEIAEPFLLIRDPVSRNGSTKANQSFHSTSLAIEHLNNLGRLPYQLESTCPLNLLGAVRHMVSRTNILERRSSLPPLMHRDDKPRKRWTVVR
jgi:hypothetical protein